MKKKIGLTSLLVMCVLMIWANPVGKKAAQQTAQEFMMQQLSSEGSRRAPQMVAVEAVQGDWQSDALYLFNAADGQGFVVVSGDDRTAPILGYSTSGRLDVDKMPSNLRSWLQHYAAQIAYIQKYDINVPKRAIQNCGDPIASTLTSRWNQSPIYNDECPLVYHFMDQACTTPYVYKDEHGQPTSAPLRAVTGCGATALAQILYYHKYPAAITAAIPAQENMVVQQMSTAGYPIYNFYSDPGVPAGTTIDWANMKDVYGYTINESNIQIPENPVTTTAERKAVADLMHYCAAALDMRYGTTQTGGSEASLEAIVLAATKYFGLPNASLCVQSSYTYQDFIQTLYDEIKVAGCTYFGGIGPEGGHAFVIDGYDKEDFFSINWGWAGAASGFFRICNLQPMPEKRPNENFNGNQVFARGLYPTAPAVPVELRVMEFSSTATVIAKESGVFRLKPFKLTVTNSKTVNVHAQLGITVEGVKTNQLTGDLDLPLSNSTTIDNPEYSTNLGALADGVYRCYLSYRASDTDEWKPCAGSDKQYLKLTVSGDNMTVENVLPYQLTLLSATGGKNEYLPGGMVMVTAQIQVESGDVHETLTSFLVPVDAEGELNMDAPSVLGSQPCYYGQGESFEFPISCQVAQEGKFALCVASTSTSVFVRVWDFQVTNTPSGIKTITPVQTTTAAPAYNLGGQRVTDSYRGLVIQKGQKVIRK